MKYSSQWPAFTFRSTVGSYWFIIPNNYHHHHHHHHRIFYQHAGTGATCTSVPPPHPHPLFQVLACCMHGRFHTRSPGVSVMRVDNRELPLSAISLFQLLPCPLEPPRPMLSINLYITGYLDCTVGAFHESIPAEHFFSGSKTKVWLYQWPSLNGKEHCAPHTRAVTRPHVLKERWREERTGSSSLTSSRQFSNVLWLKVHSHQLLRACLLCSKRKLPSPACQVRFPSLVCHPRGEQFPGMVYICNPGPLSSASHCISCAPQPLQKMLLLPSPVWQTAHEKLSWTISGSPGPYHRSWSSSFLHLLSALLFSKSRASCHIPQGIHWW